MTNIERRLRKDGSTAHLLRCVDKKSGKRKTQRFDEAKDAEFMQTVLEAHDLAESWPPGNRTHLPGRSAAPIPDRPGLSDVGVSGSMPSRFVQLHDGFGIMWMPYLAANPVHLTAADWQSC
ncbi:hypothetical protein ACX80T_03860 [Arthrobacter sp. Sr33]